MLLILTYINCLRKFLANWMLLKIVLGFKFFIFFLLQAVHFSSPQKAFISTEILLCLHVSLRYLQTGLRAMFIRLAVSHLDIYIGIHLSVSRRRIWIFLTSTLAVYRQSRWIVFKRLNSFERCSTEMTSI